MITTKTVTMTTKQQTKEPELLVSDHHGIYIAQMFCKAYSAYITNMAEVKEDFDTCLDGPDNEFYWESWENLINNVQFTNDKGEKYTIGNIGESGDLWAIPDGYEWTED
jgi:phage terminase small subunit